ncbi:hypothetical protein [Faecalimicrobium dakarense]|uniref:hypothetical protein n=1 Tax=Faecalimicrobium dakarense TaxID=1301100 RepID=UPI0004B07600|nr:hypothetical protein [[Clostridium] dakarense]
MNKKFLKILVVIFILFIFCFLYNAREIYGNNRDLIISSIKKSKLIDDKNSIKITDIIDIEDARFIGFFCDNSKIGVITFLKNHEGNYEKVDMDIKNGTIMEEFVIRYGNDINKYKYVVVSNGDKLSRIDLTINNKYTESKYIPINKYSINIFSMNLPEGDLKSINLESNFFDSSGNIIFAQ